jgi:glutaconate CoA-transferase subunit B
MTESTYTPTELLACVASRLLEDGKSIFVGTGLPLIAAMLAQRTHAPGLMLVFEAGALAPLVPRLPISVGSSRTYYKAASASSLQDVMSFSQNGYVDYGFLGGAAIDCYGNLNTTVIGDWERPKARLPGSGGANDVGSFCWRTLIIMRQTKSRFVETLPFVTTPGYLTGPGSREAAGLPAHTGPYRVISNLAVYDFHPESKRMRLHTLLPGATAADVLANSCFPIEIPEGDIPVFQPPTEDEKRILHEIDETGLILGK